MAEDAAEAIGARLADIYDAVRTGPMRGVPVCNDALRVEALGLRSHGEWAVGVVVTPWFMNLCAAALDNGLRERPGVSAERICIALPAGDVDFIGGWLDGFGALHSCSLFSPMFDFVDMAAAREAALTAIAALFDPAFLTPQPSPAGLDRRALLRGRLAGATETRP